MIRPKSHTSHSHGESLPVRSDAYGRIAIGIPAAYRELSVRWSLTFLRIRYHEYEAGLSDRVPTIVRRVDAMALSYRSDLVGNVVTKGCIEPGVRLQDKCFQRRHRLCNAPRTNGVCTACIYSV